MAWKLFDPTVNRFASGTRWINLDLSIVSVRPIKINKRRVY